MKKVIIIDDSITSLNLLKNKFADAFWETYGTTSAKEGYDMIFDVAPDLIITDAIMPFIGGFQFVKMIRNNNKTSKIPVIVYSVLPENNAKYYLKEVSAEYFLTKDENIDEIVEYANKIIEKHPLDEAYKLEILKTKFENNNLQGEPKIPEKMEDEEIVIDKSALERKFKEKYNFEHSDEKIFSDFYSVLYPILKYDFCIVCPEHSSTKEKFIYFDIRNILISPILQSALMKRYKAEEVILFKKYAPNLKMITNEEEFYSKIEFNFEYKDKTIANMAFYSKEKEKWKNEENLETVKKQVYDFLRAYYINKNSIIKKSDYSKKYSFDKFNIINKQEFSGKDDNVYIAIVNILNYSDITSQISSEDLDVLNSKISEKIINCLEKDEQVIKNDEDEYSFMIYVKDEKNIKDRLDFIVSALERINYNDMNLEIAIGACNCVIDQSYNIYEAQKRAYEALDETTKTEKTVIYNARK